MKSMFIIILFILIFSLSLTNAETKMLVKPNSSMDYDINEISFLGLQFNAVVMDMYLFTGWGIDEKEGIRQESIKAVKQLDSLKEEASSLNIDKNLDPLRKTLVEAIENYKEIYKGIDKKDIQKAQNQLADFWGKYTNDSAKIYERFDFSLIKKRLSQANESLPVFTNKNLEGLYRKGIALMNQKKYLLSFNIFSQLKNKTNKEDIAYDYVILNLCDVVGKSDDDHINATLEDIIKNSEEILSKNYSPLFYEFFIRWRTNKQTMEHGMSNWSEIPNWEYNIKRKELINKIKQYLVKNPQDVWAYKQIRDLNDFNNIQRGGAYGNDNLMINAQLYFDIDKPVNEVSTDQNHIEMNKIKSKEVSIN